MFVGRVSIVPMPPTTGPQPRRAAERSAFKRTIVTLLATALLLGACGGGEPEGSNSPNESDARLTSQSEVGLKTLGPISIGMTVEQLRRAAGVDLIPQPNFEQAMTEDNCAYMSPATIPGYVPPGDSDNKSPIAFMIADDELVRIDFLNRAFATADGIRVGSTEAEVLQAYGGGQSPPPDRGFVGKPYRYLKATPQDEVDRDFRIVFETDGQKVVKYYIGRLPHVENKNGCDA